MAKPKTNLMNLEPWRDHHKDQAIIVCGTGPSIRSVETLNKMMHHTLIGVNDVLRYIDTDYLVIIDKVSKMTEDRQEWIRKSRDTALAIFCNDPNEIHNYLSGGSAATVHIRPQVPIGNRTIDLRAKRFVHLAVTSPYSAISLAAYMGATRIGLIGVDFTGHTLVNQMNRVEKHYRAMARACERAGILLINLNPDSLLQAVRKGTFDELGEPNWQPFSRENARDQRLA